MAIACKINKFSDSESVAEIQPGIDGSTSQKTWHVNVVSLTTFPTVAIKTRYLSVLMM